MKKLVIAFSGGLDTSYCALSLSKAGYEVHAVSVNTGGFTDEEIKEIESNAYKMGVSTYTNIDAIKTYYNKVTTQARISSSVFTGKLGFIANLFSSWRSQ